MFNPLAIIKYHLYLLQLENYELDRFFKLMLQKGLLPPRQQRKSLVWTSKAKALLLVALGLHGILITGSIASASWYVVVLTVIIPIPLYFLLFTLATWLLWPLDYFLKQRIVSAAKSHMRKFPRVKIIGIAGSYGKTSMKHVLEGVLKNEKIVIATPESINTPLGIGRWIMKHVTAQTEIMIVEMGEHYRGDIKDLCEITPPDIAVITGINEAHLERLGNLDTTIRTIFELAQHSKPDALLVLNADDTNVMNHFKDYNKERTTAFYSHRDHPSAPYTIMQREFRQMIPETKYSFRKKESSQADIHVITKLMGEYVAGISMACFIVGEKLGIAEEKIAQHFVHVPSVPHRLEPIKNNDLLVIDDSYNGNPDGVREAINLLSWFVDKRIVYLTPGLVEIGSRNREVHLEIGKQLAKVADLVLLIKNSVTPFIAEGLKENGFKEDQIIWFESAQKAHTSLSDILKPHDVILFQNDWGDNYL